MLGMMSGSSLDGLDLGCWKIKISKDFKLYYECLHSETIEYSHSEIDFLKSVRNISRYSKYFDDQVGRLICDKLKKSKLSKEIDLFQKIDIVSYHGHTAKHIEKIESIQLGSPKLLFEVFNVPIIYNFRQKDIILDGNGAPLMPFLDWLLFNGLDVITLNLGGIANITSLKKNSSVSDVRGFDTGPGMSLINEAVSYFYKKKYDIDGLYSFKGEVNKKLLNDLMKMDYVIKKPPKSIHTSYFGSLLFKKIVDENKKINSNDLIRTLVQFTVNSILFNIDTFIIKEINQENIIEVVCSGGGVNHPIIMSELNKNKRYKCYSIEKKGIDPNYKETLLMSVLGYCKVKQINSNIPAVTGAKKAVVLGDLYCDEY